MGSGARTHLVAGRGICNFSVILSKNSDRAVNDLKMHSAMAGNLSLNPLSQLFVTI